MSIKHLRSWACCLLALGIGLGVACSGAATNKGSDDDEDSDGGSGAEGGAGGAGGFGGMPSACVVDCATVQTPQCQVAVCNESTGQCEIQPSALGATCDDGQFCTVSDY